MCYWFSHISHGYFLKWKHKFKPMNFSAKNKQEIDSLIKSTVQTQSKQDSQFSPYHNFNPSFPGFFPNIISISI